MGFGAAWNGVANIAIYIYLKGPSSIPNHYEIFEALAEYAQLCQRRVSSKGLKISRGRPEDADSPKLFEDGLITQCVDKYWTTCI